MAEWTWLRGQRVTAWHKKVAREVACSRCRAAVGWPCFTASGKHSATCHAARSGAYIAKVYIDWRCPNCGRAAKVAPHLDHINCPCGHVSPVKSE